MAIRIVQPLSEVRPLPQASDNTPVPRRRGIYLLPNLFTTAALFAGFYAVIAAMGGRFSAAAAAIFVAMIMDGLDGRVARLTNTSSDFGKEYDSLSDMVSFGLAPALMFSRLLASRAVVQPFATSVALGSYWLTRLQSRSVTPAMSASAGWLAETVAGEGLA